LCFFFLFFFVLVIPTYRFLSLSVITPTKKKTLFQYH
jgi:hypothetical protein